MRPTSGENPQAITINIATTNSPSIPHPQSPSIIVIITSHSSFFLPGTGLVWFWWSPGKLGSRNSGRLYRLPFAGALRFIRISSWFLVWVGEEKMRGMGGQIRNSWPQNVTTRQTANILLCKSGII